LHLGGCQGTLSWGILSYPFVSSLFSWFDFLFLLTKETAGASNKRSIGLEIS